MAKRRKKAKKRKKLKREEEDKLDFFENAPSLYFNYGGRFFC